MVRQGRAAVLPTNLPHLQNLIKRDPVSYRDEFMQQWRYYETSLDIFLVQPDGLGNEFASLIGFIAQVAPCYPQVTAQLPNQLAELLVKLHDTLRPEIREKLLESLVLLRNKSFITPSALVTAVFPLFRISTSRALRRSVYDTLANLLRNENRKTRNERLNRLVQSLLFDIVTDPDASLNGSGLFAIRLTKEMWRRNVWSGDAKAVEIMRQACLHSEGKTLMAAIYFFLGRDDEEGDDDDDESSSQQDIVRKLQHQSTINKSSKARDRHVARALAAHRRREQERKRPSVLNFSALQLIHDPQGFCELVFHRYLTNARTKVPAARRPVVLQLVTRLIGLHRLILLALYPYMLKFLTPRQRDVTQYLAFTAQATHDLVPPDALLPLVLKIANEFVTGGVASEVVAAGINGIREICARQPGAMTPELLQDLAEYKASKDKGVIMASRGLIALYREVAPELLKRRDRGRQASMLMQHKAKPGLVYGVDRQAVRGIEGLELLDAYHKEMGGDDPEDEARAWKEWEDASDDDSDDSEGWINVASDGEINLTDSEDDSGSEDKESDSGSDEDDSDEDDSDDEEEEEEEEEEEGDGDDAKAESSTTDMTTPAQANMADAATFESIATRKILTPADLRKLQELREKAVADGAKGLINKREMAENVDVADIEGPRKRAKQDKEARLASVMAGREGRAKYGSLKGEKKQGKSTTNREKSRNKAFMMTIHKRGRGTKGRSLMDTQKRLHQHVDRQRRAKR